MSYHERCDTLNKNPILVARHFQNRVEMFFQIIVLDGWGSWKNSLLCDLSRISSQGKSGYTFFYLDFKCTKIDKSQY